MATGIMMWKQVQCPTCKSYKVESYKFSSIKFGLWCIAAALFVLWITEHYILVFAFLITGVFFLYKAFRNSRDYTCKICRYKFKINY